MTGGSDGKKWSWRDWLAVFGAVGTVATLVSFAIIVFELLRLKCHKAACCFPKARVSGKKPRQSERRNNTTRDSTPR